MNKPTVWAKGSELYSLEQALLIYRARKYGEAYVTINDVDKGTIGAGKPATAANLKQFVAEMTKAATSAGVRGWMSPRVLYMSPELLVWHRPAEAATVWFSAPLKKGGKTSIHIVHPSLVFAVAEGRWYVWALPTSDRPGSDTWLSHAPYMNVYDDGAICTGNVALPKVIGPSTIEGFEKAFFDSKFTHPNADKTTRTPMKDLWASLIARTVMLFPNDELVPANVTLGQVVAHLERDGPAFTGDDDDEN